MTPEAAMEQLFCSESIDGLKSIIRQIMSVEKEAVHIGFKGMVVQAQKWYALKLARYILRQRTAVGSNVAENLRIAANLIPPTDVAGVRNLATWVGLNTPEWHAVFDWSDNRPGNVSPWFIYLDTQAQQICLDLIASILEG